MITVTDANTLRERVWELAQNEPDPYAVAQKIRDELTTTDQLELAVQLAFPYWVRHLMTQMPPTTFVPELAPVLYDDGHGGKTSNPNKATAASSYRRRLAASVQTAEGWTTLGACVVEQVDYLAQVRRKKAAEDMAAAIRFEKLAQAMRDYNANKVQDLPDEIGESILKH